MPNWGNDDYTSYLSSRPTWGDYNGVSLENISHALHLDDGMPENGTLESIDCHVHSCSASSEFQAALYSFGSDGTDGSLLEESSEDTPGALSEEPYSIAMAGTYSLVSGTDYSIAMIGNNIVANNGVIHTNWTSGGYTGSWDYHDSTWDGGGFATTANFNDNVNSIDAWMWLVYSVSGGGGRKIYKPWGNHPLTKALITMKEMLPCGCENPAYSHHFDDQTGRFERWKKGSQILVPRNYRGNDGNIRRISRAA